MSDSDDNVDKLFESSDEEDAGPQQRSREPAAAAESDQLRQSDGEDADMAPQGQATTPVFAPNRRFADDDEDAEDFAEPERDVPLEPEPGPPLHLEGPLITGPDSSTIRLVRASNILGVQSKPFSPDTHELEPEEYEDPTTGQLKVRLANAIRWRNVQQPDGSTTRESNARFVRWSDGSLQLMVGDEVLDVAETDVSGDHHFMYVRHRGFIQAQAQLDTRMAFRPSSIKSRAHKRLTAVMDKRHGFKGSRMQATTTVMDPHREKAERARAEEARIRDREGLAKRQEKEMRKYTRAPASRATGGLSAAYLEAADEEGEEEEEYEEEAGVSVSERARRDLSRPRQDAAAEAEAELRLASAKRGVPPASGGLAKRQRAAYDLDEDEDGEIQDFIVDEEEDDDEEAVGAARKPAARRRMALSDDEDD